MSVAPGGNRGAIAAYITVGALYTTIFTVPPLIAPVFHDRLGLSFADAGLLMTVYLAAFAAVSLPAGMLADRFGPAKVIATGLLLAGTASILFPLWHTLGWFLLLRFAVGAGTALVYTPGIALVRALLPPGKAHVGVGLFSVGLTAGLTAAYFATPRIEQAIGWQWPFRIAGCLALGSLVALALVPRRGWVRGSGSLGNPLAGMGRLFRNPLLMIVSAALFLNMFVLYGVLTYVQSFLAKDGDFSPSGLSNSGLVIAASSIPASIIGGWLADRLGKPAETMALFSLTSAVVVLLWVLPHGNGATLVIVAVVSVFAGSASVVPLFTLPSLAVPAADAGVATGLATTVGMAGAILSTYLGGWIIDWSGFGIAFLVFAVAAAATALAAPLISAQLRPAAA